MSLTMQAAYKGITLPSAIFTVETVTISSQLDFSVVMRADAEGERLSTEFYGCEYDATKDPFDQAYAYLRTLDKFASAI